MPSPRPHTLVALIVASLLAGCSADGARKKPTASPPAPAKPSGPTFPVKEGPLTIYHRADWPGFDVRLLGVDPTSQRAVVWLSSKGPAARVAIDVIDFGKAERVERWEATGPNAANIVDSYPIFRPLTGAFDDDLRRFAGLIGPTGPWTWRSPASLFPIVSPDGRFILYGTVPPKSERDGDWLMLADAELKSRRRLDQGLIASYSPTFSPDGRQVAFSGCSPTHAARGTNCSYYLFIAPVDVGVPRFVPVPNPKDPVWSPADGDVYAVGRRRGRACLYRVDVHEADKPRELVCTDDLQEVRATLDPTGAFAVLAGSTGPAGQQVYVYRWIDLATGEVKATREVERALGLGPLSTAGKLAVPVQNGGVAIVDLATGQTARHDDVGSLRGLQTTRWLGDELILVRWKRGMYEVVGLR